MSKSAPRARLVNALNGEKAPPAYLKAVDHLVAELEELHELRTRVAELTAERDLLIADRDAFANCADRLSVDLDELTAERDNLVSDLVDLREAHAFLVGRLAKANDAVARYERQGW